MTIIIAIECEEGAQADAIMQKAEVDIMSVLASKAEVLKTVAVCKSKFHLNMEVVKALANHSDTYWNYVEKSPNPGAFKSSQ